ncbi:ATP-grasp domain-containing protein [Methylophaga sp.]|uniref:ATP-grasp domain-containing protein n=1 Tax=Methylophaga sp. TaxID=2024840 RepID=UPI003F69D982
MTLFIYEHLTSGALSGEPYSVSLMHEGNAMLQAITNDLLALGHHIVTMRDARLDNTALTEAGVYVREITSLSDYQLSWDEAIKQYHQFLLIAPETDNVLADLTQNLEQQYKTVLGCDSLSIGICSDKILTYHHLQQNGFCSPTTLASQEWLADSHDTDASWAIKPRDGAGCEQTYCLNTDEARESLANDNREWIVQPFIAGENLSLSLFMTKDDIELLSINIQHIEMNGRTLTLKYCEPHRQDQLDSTVALELASSIHATMPGLWGFVGIDLIKTENTLWIIDINPRLTSSYAEAAMRQKKNPAYRLHQSLHNKLPGQ